jgi:2-dehydropantoate 2-reductase
MVAGMRIGVVGCGAVGSYYGGRLAVAGHNVHFLLRSDYETVARSGVQVESPAGSFTAHPIAAKTSDKIGICDLVIVALKTTANSCLPDILPALAGPGTIVLTLQNGLGNEDFLAALVKPAQVMGGLCFVCLNRVAPGKIVHLAHGQIMLGELTPTSGGRLDKIASTFRAAGIVCATTSNLAAARWEKLVWNIPFNGLGVAAAAGFEAVNTGVFSSRVGPCLTTDQLIADPRWESLVRQLMLEVIAAARAQGLPLTNALVEEKLNLTRSMGPYKPSTLLDFERRQALELDSMFLEPLRRAKAAGATVPTLERLCAVLQGLDR